MKTVISSKYINLVCCFIIVVIAFALYANTLGHEYNLDDSYYINLLPKEDSNFSEVINVITKRFSKSDYRPIPALHLALEQYFLSQKPGVFHFFNVLYYALLGIALFILFNQLKIFPNKWAVLLLVTLFLIHPSHSNVVSSIKNRDVILAMLYGVLAIISFVKFFDTSKFLYLLISTVLFAISLLCKLDATMFLFVGTALLYFSRSINWKKVLMPLAFLFSLVIGLYVISSFFVAEKALESAVTEYFENPLADNSFLIKNIPLKLYLVNYYHKFMVVPTKYFFYFGYNQIPIPSSSSLKVIVSSIIHLLVFLIVIGLLLKRKRSNLILGFIVYFIFLLPIILFLDSTAGIIAVRYSFNASLGFSLILTAVLLYGYHSKKKVFKFASMVVLSIILITSIFFTNNRNKDWKNKETLFSHDLKYLKQSYMANRMGGLYFKFLEEQETTNSSQKQKYLTSASKYLNTAKGIYDQDPILWQNLGLLYWKQENYKQAFLSFKNAVSLDSTNTISWNYYGNFSEFANDLNRAEEAYRQIVSIEPNNVLGYKNLTFVLIGQQKIEEAINLNQPLIGDDEMGKYGYENIGHIYLSVGDTLNAIQYFNQAFKEGLVNDLLKMDIDRISKTF